nr:hypothetical protein CFP56_03426 [Quercus suber]
MVYFLHDIVCRVNSKLCVIWESTSCTRGNGHAKDFGTMIGTSRGVSCISKAVCRIQEQSMLQNLYFCGVDGTWKELL